MNNLLKTSLIFCQRTETFFLDMLFPISCLLCQKENIWICKTCLEKIAIADFQVCPYCEKGQSSGGYACERCKRKQRRENKVLGLDSLVSATKYRDISHLVHLFKYRFISDLGEPLGKLLAKAALKNNITLPDLIVPVPIHKRKLRWRGFNQAELLAETLAENLTPGFQIPVDSKLLYRRKNTSPQMKIKNYQARFSNMENAFALDDIKSDLIQDKNILLVDDIATTGATLFECAKILKEGGARQVSALIIARQKTLE